MQKKALIIFVRNPIPGKVKTRIAESAGDVTALLIYRQLLQHTAAITRPVEADKFVFYSNEPEMNDCWDDEIYHKDVQQGTSLGEKMQRAFEQLFTAGYEQICIIGSDCYELNNALIQQAFATLEKKDAVIGPAADGGYYLLGLSKMLPAVFTGKAWSTSSVYAATIADFRSAGFTYELLPVLNDVDRLEDVPAHFLQ